jgi:hypothetical protein
MKYAGTLFTGLVLTGISLGVTACQQAPAPIAAAPAETTAPAAPATPPPQVIVQETRPRVVEERQPRDRPRAGVEVDVHKQGDRDHAVVDVHAHP